MFLLTSQITTLKNSEKKFFFHLKKINIIKFMYVLFNNYVQKVNKEILNHGE